MWGNWTTFHVVRLVLDSGQICPKMISDAHDIHSPPAWKQIHFIGKTLRQKRGTKRLLCIFRFLNPTFNRVEVLISIVIALSADFSDRWANWEEGAAGVKRAKKRSIVTSLVIEVVIIVRKIPIVPRNLRLLCMRCDVRVNSRAKYISMHARLFPCILTILNGWRIASFLPERRFTWPVHFSGG